MSYYGINIQKTGRNWVQEPIIFQALGLNGYISLPLANYPIQLENPPCPQENINFPSPQIIEGCNNSNFSFRSPQKSSINEGSENAPWTQHQVLNFTNPQQDYIFQSNFNCPMQDFINCPKPEAFPQILQEVSNFQQPLTQEQAGGSSFRSKNSQKISLPLEDFNCPKIWGPSSCPNGPSSEAMCPMEISNLQQACVPFHSQPPQVEISEDFNCNNLSQSSEEIIALASNINCQKPRETGEFPASNFPMTSSEMAFLQREKATQQQAFVQWSQLFFPTYAALQERMGI